jgi:hypothetical protein
MDDPHADIDALCDALAVTLLLLHDNEICAMSEARATAANQRLIALQHSDADTLITAAIGVMVRNKVVH